MSSRNSRRMFTCGSANFFFQATLTGNPFTLDTIFWIQSSPNYKTSSLTTRRFQKFCKWVFPWKQQMDSTCVSWTWRTHLTNFTWGRHYLTGRNRCVTGGRRVIAVNTQFCGGRGQPNDCGHKYRRQVKVDFHWNQSGRPVQVPSLFF